MLTHEPNDVRSFTQALWYAWGAKDFGASLPGEPFDFARDYATRQRAFRCDREGMMPSMQRAFTTWLAGQPID
jgi:hypothetical protein